MELPSIRSLIVLALLAGCGNSAPPASSPASPSDPEEPVTPTSVPADSRATATSRPVQDWPAHALDGGRVEARLPQEPSAIDLGGGATLHWSAWDGAGFAIALRTSAAAVADADVDTLARLATAAMLDGLFGVEPGTIPASDVTQAGPAVAAPSHGDWTVQSMTLEASAMGQAYRAHVRTHRNAGRLVMQLLVAEPALITNAEAFFETLDVD